MNGSSHPESRVSTISRRFASKVLSMIEKYESLSHTTIHDQAPQPAESNFRRLGKSVLARARLLFENAAADQRTNQRTVPPKRRFLKFKKRRMRGTKNGSNGFDYDGAISSDGNSNTPSEMETETSSDLTVSTPPVARILPSSFFKKLAAVKEPVVERKPEPRGVKWRRRRVSPRMGSVRLDMSRRESNFAEIRRRIVPPKVSVRDLKERFQEAERACTHKELKMEEMDGSSRMRARRKILNKGKGVSKNSVRRNVMSGGVDKSFKRFEKDQKLGYIDSSSDFFYDDFDSKEFVSIP